MAYWKKLLLIGVGWGLGAGFALAICVGSFMWYEQRPKPPKPWDTTSITAKFDSISTEGDDNALVFYYTVENKTDFDYRAENDSSLQLSGKTVKEQSLVPLTVFGRVDYPLFIPAMKRQRLEIHLDGYNYPSSEKETQTNRDKYREQVRKYVAERLKNLGGFEILDKNSRYDIIFPSGWSEAIDSSAQK